MSKKFIKVATQAVATGAGAVATGLASQRITFIPRNLHGIVFTAVGIVGEAYMKQEIAKSFFRGMSTFGAIRLAEDNLLKNPDLAGVDGVDFDEIGYVEENIAGLEGNAFADIDGLGALDEIAYLDGVDDEFGEIDEFGEVDDEFGEIDEFGEVDEFGEIDEFGEVDDEFGEVDDEFGEIEDII